MKYLIISLIGIIGSIIFIYSQKKGSDKARGGSEPQGNIFNDIRSRALSVTLKDLGIDEKTDVPFGAVMEFTIDASYVTVISYRTGDASIYLSNGGGFIGGITHENVRQAAINFMNSVAVSITAFNPASDTKLPEIGFVGFYALTMKGMFYINAAEKEVQNPNHPLFNLYSKGQEVITEFRKVAR